jgi:hypothetical protein
MLPGSNLRQKTFRINADSLKIDTISIVPKTFSIVNVPDSTYRLDFVNAVLYWNKKPGRTALLLFIVCFPFKLNPVAQRMSFDSVMNNFYVTPFEFNNGLTNAQRGIFDLEH